jgi:hypothetical protein
MKPIDIRSMKPWRAVALAAVAAVAAALTHVAGLPTFDDAVLSVGADMQLPLERIASDAPDASAPAESAAYRPAARAAATHAAQLTGSSDALPRARHIARRIPRRPTGPRPALRKTGSEPAPHDARRRTPTRTATCESATRKATAQSRRTRSDDDRSYRNEESDMARNKVVRIYSEPAGGWGALKATGEALAVQGIAVSGAKTLLQMNQPEGFDCPGCAWPDPKHTSSFEFCENGAKAVAWEATAKRCTPAFFAAHSVAELETWDDYDLEMAGRLTHPMIYERASDRYVPIEWDAAFALIGKHLNALDHPDQADFYTSGRASNEAAFLYQLFVREFGTNNFPDCSNMCHEATSVGLPQSIGVGKGTVLLEDFEHADAIFIFGQNPGTNSPRMMSDLHAASRRGAKIVSFNPFRERALERFAAPQDPLEMATLGSTPISTFLYQVRVGGDVAVLKGMMKALVEADDAAPPQARRASSTPPSSPATPSASTRCWPTCAPRRGTR